ncbi:MAG: MCE family protein [Desulfuromonadales bacterium]|nr:MAG: MCE family protein [Desulfuromonadales bacterium]
MSDAQQNQELSDIPEAVAEPKRRHSVQLVWLIPIVAAIIGGTLAVKTFLQKGPTIRIYFKTGEGLEAGKTKIKYKDVEVGLVKSIVVAKDLKHVIATAELKKETKPYLVEDTRFWVVRPRISGGSVSGLGTVMGGSYIGIDIGKSEKPQRTFRGLDEPPAVTMDEPGSRFLLHSTDLGSLDIGSPLYFRRIQVGQVVSYELDKGGTGVTFTVFVAAPYDQHVKANTRFWNASGIDLSMDASGLKLNTQSMVSILIGGIAFQTLDEGGDAPPPSPNTAFTLFASRDEAMKRQDTISQDYVLAFTESVRGLTVGAPVDFRGMTVGEVTDIQVELDNRTKGVNMLVYIRYYPQRLRSRAIGPIPSLKDHESIITKMVENGLRAQLKSGNLLTGQLLVALDFFPTAPKAKVNWATTPPQFPTTPGSLAEMQTTLTQIIKKLEKLPLDEVVGEVRQTVQTLDATLKSADKVVRRMDAEVVPEARSALEEARKTLGAAKQTLAADAPLQQDLREALRELARTAQSLRVLTDYLERHPEALIRGKQEDAQ